MSLLRGERGISVQRGITLYKKFNSPSFGVIGAETVSKVRGHISSGAKRRKIILKVPPPLLACAPLWGGHIWARRGHRRAQRYASSHILQHLF